MAQTIKTAIGMALCCLGLITVLPVWANEAMPPAAQPGSPVLILPKGTPVTVTGMTGKGGTPATQPTTVTASWDDEGLTVVFDCTDTALVAEWAETRDSDKTWKDDSVAVLLDIGHHHYEADNLIMFKLSVAGGLQDCRGKGRDIYFNVPGVTSEITFPPVPIPAWRIMPPTPEQIKAAAPTGVLPNHWRGTIRIPWMGLGMKPKEGDIWGVNFTRIDQPGLNFMAWAPFDGNFEEMRSFGHLLFATKDAPSDDKGMARELVRQDHVRSARESVNEGNILTLSGTQPVNITDFRVIKSGAPAKQATSATLSSSGDKLDIVIDCADTGIVAEQKGHDNVKLWKDDSVYIWLDPGHTHNPSSNIMVQISASGEWLDQRNGDLKFEIEGMAVTVSRIDTGWRVHVTMPWKGLGMEPPKPGDVWGVNLTRMDQPGKLDYENMESSSWLALPNGDPATLDRWGHIVFGGGTDGTQAANIAQQSMAKTHEARWQAIMVQNTK